MASKTSAPPPVKADPLLIYVLFLNPTLVSSAAELSTIPTGANRLKELADVAAFLCELSEEAADPTLDQRLNMDVYPLTFFKNVCRGVTEALGIRNTTSIRVWMVR